MAKKKVTPISELRSAYGRPETAYLDTGIFPLNDIWGGGMPTGKIIEIHSGEGLGKTTMVVQALVSMIKKLKIKAAYLDVENALDLSLRTNLGTVEFENDDKDEPSFAYLCPYTYDEVSKSLNILTRGSYDVIVYDSIANTSLDVDADDSDFAISRKLGQHAYLQGELLKLFKGRLARSGKTLIVINQMRTNIVLNPMKAKYAPDLKPAGGKVLDHNFDIRTSIERVTFLIDDDKTKVGAVLRLTTIKNKVAQPYRQVELELVFGWGINKISTLATVLKNKGMLAQAGAWYTFPNGVRANGWEQVREYIRNNYQECLTFMGDSSYQVNVLGTKIDEGSDINTGVPAGAESEVEDDGIGTFNEGEDDE